ncbi:MFS transporter [Candidatus Enterococcus ikei]|uniref:MFS transporter n=1 Tax=Candidatus Enterococcus ikei TaxID=2815326 RepID=A0ABS3GXS8_9ENTE|nr:MFS transporter [Enterococcus sp. DIV0869a]MBO0440070.1 MFS transporter [Enterococcus sp. DIV0869a]
MDEIKEKKKRMPYWKQIIYILTIGWIVIWIYRTVLTPIYPIISDYFGGATDAQLGHISSFYFLGYVCMQIPSGLLVDKLGKKQILIPGFLLFGLGALVVGLAQNIGLVFIGSILAGLGCGTYYGVAYSLTAEYVPVSKRSLATAIVNSGTAIGSGLGLISSSYLVGTGLLPWQTLIFATIVLILLSIIMFIRYIRLEKTKNPVVINKDAEVKKRTSIKALFKPRMISAYILYFSTLYTYYLIDTWLPNFLETEKGFSGTSIGLASSLVFFTAIPGALIFSRIADSLPKKKIQLIILLEVLAASVLFLTVTTTNQTILVIGIMAYGFFGKLAVEPIIISWLGESAPKGSVATMYGVFNFFGMSSSVIVPSLTGTISDLTGSKIYAFYLAILIIGVGTCLFYLINRVIGEQSKIED